MSTSPPSYRSASPPAAAAASRFAAAMSPPNLSSSSLSPDPGPGPLGRVSSDLRRPDSFRSSFGSGSGSRSTRNHRALSRGGGYSTANSINGITTQGGLRGAVATASQAAAALLRWAQTSAHHALAYYIRLSPLHRALATVAGVVACTLALLALVYSHRIFAALGPMAKGWHDLPGGWILVWLMIFATGFPPIIGYSTACTVAGLVYGFPWGWPIAASANVAGSLAAFYASRGVLSGYVDRLVGHDHRFVALSQVLHHDGLVVLSAVRFCPLPYSLSNGFLATIPSITPASFAASTALASPKLLVHVFIGSRLARLAADGDSMSAGAKALNYMSMAVFGMVGLGVGLFIFRRTMARAAEIQLAEEQGEQGLDGHGVSPATRPPGVYADEDMDDYNTAPLMDPEDADVAALMDDDDISLWAADHFADGDGTGSGGDSAPQQQQQQQPSRTSYHDESDDGDLAKR